MITPKIFLALMLIFNFSCSTSDKKITYKDSDMDDVFNNVSNEDFKKVQPVAYTQSDDYITPTDGSQSSVKAESSQMLPEDVLDELQSGKDPLLVMVSYCRRGKFDIAVKLADGLYDKYFKHPSYWNQLGSCYFRKGDLVRASLLYNKSRVTNAKYAPAINNLGVVYQTRGYEEKAFAAYRKAEAASPYALTPKLNVANLLLKYGHYEKAKVIFEKLLSAGPSDPVALNGLAVSEMMSGEYSRAVSLFKRIDEKTLRSMSVATNYAYALGKLKMIKEAKEVLGNIEGKGDGHSALKSYHSTVLTMVDKG